MSQKYFAILTQYGAAEIASATAQNKTLNFETMAVGDGNGKDTTPNENQTQLIKENYRCPINALTSEAGKNTVIAELIIKEQIGGWWIREMGIYDDKGGLIAVANCPASYKPQLEEGSGKVQTLRMVLIVSNTAAVTLSVSQDIGIASIELVEDTMRKHIADDDPHSKDYYNKALVDKSNAAIRKDLSELAVLEANRGRDEAVSHTNQADAAHLAAADPHAKDYYNKALVDQSNAGIRNDLVVTAVNEGSRGRDEAINHANQADASHLAAADPHAKDYYNKALVDQSNAGIRNDLVVTAVNEGSRGRDEAINHAIQADAGHIGAANPHGERYYLKGEADVRYPLLAGYLGQSIELKGVYNSNAEMVSEEKKHNWTSGAFNNYTQFLLDKKSAWLASQRTQHSQGYALLSRIGTHRTGSGYGASMLFQMVGESDTDLGTWEMRSDGSFFSKNLILSRATAPEDYSRITFEKKYPLAERQVLGAITWDTFRDVLPVSNVAAVWAEGAGVAGNSGELHFGVTSNGTDKLPAKSMSIIGDTVYINKLSVYGMKSSDPAMSMADQTRDYDGVVSTIRWKNYGNGHVIFDGSKGISPDGSQIKDSARADEPWQRTYPILMGWNGQSTFGVRVDNARTADAMTDGTLGVPAGIPLPWPGNTPPPGWIFLQGQGINPAEAPVLASLYGPTLPDMRGMYISGWDAGRGIDPGRNVLSYQAANVGQHEHGIAFRTDGIASVGGSSGRTTYDVVREPTSTVNGPAGRTHPDNIAFNYIVRWG